MSDLDIFILAAEPSGDLHGAKLIEELLKIHPHLKIGAVAGPRMRALPIETFFPMENLQVMGFIDVLLALPKIVRQFFAIRRKILQLSPKAVICIDYPGFNLALEKSLRKKKYRGKLIHFICPTVWAWKKKRIPRMAETLDLLLTIFPFEPKCFEKTSLKVQYVGHPLAKTIHHFTPIHLFKEQKLLTLFPGSRSTEIERNLPIQLQVARRLQTLDPTLKIAISIAHSQFKEQIKTLSQDILLVPPKHNYELMRASHLAIATSGTVTLELALHGTPTVVNFAIKPLDCFIAQKIFKIHLPFYCIVNIIASKSVFPELFGPHLTPDQLFSLSQKLWFDSEARAACLKDCAEVRKSLGLNDASKVAAEAIVSAIDF